MTQAIIEVAKPLGISVHDHINVGKDGHCQLQGSKSDLILGRSARGSPHPYMIS
jgi:hypothetical protein